MGFEEARARFFTAAGKFSRQILPPSGEMLDLKLRGKINPGQISPDSEIEICKNQF